MTRPAWINVALYAMSKRPICMFAISFVVILAWWNLADFYMFQRYPRWPELSEPAIVFVLSTLLVVVLVAVTRRQIKKGLEGFAFPAPGFSMPSDRKSRHAMLTVIVDNCGGIACRYATWLRDSGYRSPPWVSVFLFFGLLSFLAIPPLHSSVMESLSALTRTTPGSLVGVPADPLRAPDKIFNIRNVVAGMTMVNNRAVQNETEYRLMPKDGQWVRAPDSIEAAIGGATTKLRFFSGDFPHLHRHVDVECLPPGCIVRREPGASLVRLPVRAGVAELEYLQPRMIGISSVPPLNVHAWLTTPWGFRMFSILIERK